MTQRREGELLMPFISVLLDAVVIEISFLISYWLRFYSPLVQYIPVTKGFPPISAYFKGSLFLIVVWIFIFQRFDLYGLRRQTSPIDEFSRLLKAVSLGMLVMMSATFFYRGFSYSRLVFLYVWIISIILLLSGRMFLLKYKHFRYARGHGLLNVAIIGSGKWTNILFEKLHKYPEIGFKIVGCIGNIVELTKKTKYLGEINELPEIIQMNKIHVLLLVLRFNEHELLWDIIKMCEGVNVEFMMLPDQMELMTSQLQVVRIGGIPMLQIKDVRIKGWQGVLKRAFDIICSILGLLILSPILLIAAILIKFTSEGPVFYRQMRLGFDDKEFWIYKFRSMRIDAEKETGPIWATENDPRVTLIGRILRRTSIDELPQLMNVLLGDMSIVGPRPERSVFVERFRKSIPKYLERHRVKSGMTGWAQVNGLRGNTPIEERTKYDIYYVENWSLAFDFEIILKTIWVVISGKNSY